MTVKEVYDAVLIEIGTAREPDDAIAEFNYYINRSIRELVDVAFRSFEETQEISDILQALRQPFQFLSSSLIKTGVVISGSGISTVRDGRYLRVLPSDYFHMLNCVVTFQIRRNYQSFRAGNTIETAVRRLVNDRFVKIMDNAWLKPSWKSPYFNITTQIGQSTSTIEFLYGSDLGTFDISEVSGAYLRKPATIKLTPELVDSSEDLSPLMEFPESVCLTIIQHIVNKIRSVPWVEMPINPGTTGFETEYIPPVALIGNVDGISIVTGHMAKLLSADGSIVGTSMVAGTVASHSVMLTLTSQGTGTGVGDLYIKSLSPTSLTLIGDAHFYSNDIGTLGESVATQTGIGYQHFYIRVHSGTAYLVFSEPDKLLALGEVHSSGSGIPGWSYKSTEAGSNVPKLIIDNWFFPNCTDIALFSSNIASLTLGISQLPPVLEKFIHMASGTISGVISNMPRSCKIFTALFNTLSGDVVDLPPGLQGLSLYGTTTITGALQSLTRSLTYIVVQGSNTLYGDLSGLPPDTAHLQIAGNNNVTGDIASLPASVYYISLSGYNTVYGQVDNLKTGLITFQVTGLNTISGSLTNIPSTVTWVYIYGQNTINGDFTGLSPDVSYISVHGSNQISGDLSQLPLGKLIAFIVTGNNAITGNLSSLSSSTKLATVDVTGYNVITGALSSIPDSLRNINIAGNNTVYGNISDVSPYTYKLWVTGNNVIDGYTQRTWLTPYISLIVNPVTGGGLSSLEVDQLLNDLIGMTYNSNMHLIQLLGTNAPRTSSSDTAVATLTSKNITVSTNP